MNKKIAITLLLATAVGISIWLGGWTYYVEGSSGWQMVCGKSECYLFIEQGHSGWAVKRYRYAEAYVRSLLFSAFRPTHHTPHETLMVRITATSTAERLFPGTLTPMDAYASQLYVIRGYVQDPHTCKLTDIDCQKLSSAEEDALQVARQAGLTNISNNNQGWTKYWLLDKPLKVSLADGDLTFTEHGDTDSTRSISVSQQNQKPGHIIWSFDESGRTVSKQEYEKLFGPT